MWDAKRGQGAIHTRNSDAQTLYYKGAFDVLTAIKTWMDDGVPTDEMAAMLQNLTEQSEVESNR